MLAVTCCPGGKCYKKGEYSFGCIDPEMETKLNEPATPATPPVGGGPAVNTDTAPGAVAKDDEVVLLL